MIHPVAETRAESPDRALSVSRLNEQASSLLERNFPAVLVEGEISNFSMPASGHWYLTLRDEKSRLSCAMFRYRNQRSGFQPRNGMLVQVRGKLSIYGPQGNYQLIADSMEQAGDGALRRAFDELKNKLGSEGLFANEHKQPVSKRYRHIGIITSRTGAAVQDMLSVFRHRFPMIRLTLFAVSVQGRQAATEIVDALARANRLGPALGIEALIVGRGGGSLEDLQAFNEEAVARAVFASKLPVTSAVGHETDFTITDFVADLRAQTPSAAAELMSPHQREYLDKIATSRRQLLRAMNSLITGQADALRSLARQLKRPDRHLQDIAQTLDRLEGQLQRAMRNQLQRSRIEVLQRERALTASSPAGLLRVSASRLASESNRLNASIKARLLLANSKLEQLARNLNAISPLAVLARGYSLTSDESNRLLRRSDQVNVNDAVRTRLADGELTSVVTAIHPESAAGASISKPD